jgi:hypothetical protein
MEKERSELEKAIELVENSGHIVAHQFSHMGADYIGELHSILNAGNYRIVSVDTVLESEKKPWRGLIKLEVVPLKRLEAFERGK